ncbi:MAG: cardiolipin synthase ClsB [Betaproteobacteria bacterium]|nr:cardiolipin synthase ClsB [Betaproteobacteria bacterium]
MTRFSDGNQVALLRTGDEYFPALERAIDEARSEVHLETYIFADDPTGHRIAQALARAAGRGVAVRVLVDGFGAANLRASLREILEPSGVRVLVYRPERGGLRLRRHRLRRLHRKLVVIDGAIGFCGGINVLDDRNGTGHGPPRFDFAVEVHGPIVRDMHDAARRLWTLVRWTTGRGGRSREGSRLHASTPRTAGRQALFLTRDNLRNRRAIEDAYLDAIEHARTEIFIANAYFLPGRRFRRALREARMRGVRVRLLLQGRREYLLVHYAMRALYGSFIDAGIELHDYIATYLHAKVAVVDGRWATVGSSNIDPFSLLLSREANVVVVDEAFAAELRASLEFAEQTGSVAILRDAWADRPWSARVLAWMAFQLGRMFVGMTGYARPEDF